MHPGDIADMLHRIKRSLINHRVSTDAMVINARVPLVMYTDAESGVQVDISVCNHSGVFKCRFIKMMTQFDDRFEALYRLVSCCGCIHTAVACFPSHQSCVFAGFSGATIADSKLSCCMFQTVCCRTAPMPTA